MILIRHVVRLIGAAVAYGIATRRISVPLVVIVGLVLVAVVTTTKVIAPIVVYPFV